MNELITSDNQQYNGQNRVANYQTVSQAVSLAAAVLDKRIATAKQWPRSVSRFKQEAIELLQSDVETALSAEYSKPVGGGSVRGPSVRLTEIASLCWGNIEIEISDPIISETSVTVQAMAWDLERNIRMPGIATTSIINKQGVRYPQHLIETTISAAASKARRNATLAVIPRAYINDLLAAAKLVANKNQKPLEQVRSEMLEYFARSFKVESAQVFGYLSVNGVDDIKLEHIDELRAVATAIKEGEPAETYFGKPKSKTELVKEKIESRKKKNETSLIETLIAEIESAKTESDYDQASNTAESHWDQLTEADKKRIDAAKRSTAKRIEEGGRSG
jgi:hypothetical protein